MLEYYYKVKREVDHLTALGHAGHFITAHRVLVLCQLRKWLTVERPYAAARHIWDTP